MVWNKIQELALVPVDAFTFEDHANKNRYRGPFFERTFRSNYATQNLKIIVVVIGLGFEPEDLNSNRLRFD